MGMKSIAVVALITILTYAVIRKTAMRTSVFSGAAVSA